MHKLATVISLLTLTRHILSSTKSNSHKGLKLIQLIQLYSYFPFTGKLFRMSNYLTINEGINAGTFANAYKLNGTLCLHYGGTVLQKHY